MSDTHTERLAGLLHAIGPENVTQAAMGWAVAAVLDTVGVTLAGSGEPCAQLLLRTPGIAEGPGPALILGGARRTAMLDAALINGTASHALDYDDVCGATGGHPSVTLVAPLLALAEARRASGRDLLVSYLVGVEIQLRLARAVNFHHYNKGWHPTGTLGVFGAAAASAHLLRLDRARMATALGMAASMASGLKANFGTMTKPLHVGRCARDGLLAALLAERGYTANSAALEHRHGFFEVFNGAGTYDPARMELDRGGSIDLEPSLGLKQFPCCGSTHAAVAMMLRLVREEGLTPEHAAQVEILVHRDRLAHTDNPDPRDDLAAKFSIQYAVARALTDGAVRLAHFEHGAHAQARVRQAMARVSARPHPDIPDDPQLTFGAEVVVTTTDGRRLARRVPQMVGRGPDNPMNAAELREKFLDCAGRALPVHQASHLADLLLRLPMVMDIGEITAAFVRIDNAGRAAG